jgi:hypothetical protein
MCAQQNSPPHILTNRERRRLLIDMAKRRVQPGTGSSHVAMSRRTAMLDWPDLRTILKDIDWVIVGDVATRAYMPERMTKDLDILINTVDESIALSCLKAAGYAIVQPLAIAGYALRSDDGMEIDLLLGSHSWLEEALAQPEIDPAGYPVLGLPYLILMKMASSRGRDLGDITTMLGWANEETLNQVRAVVSKYSRQDSEDLESLIFIGQQERRSMD